MAGSPEGRGFGGSSGTAAPRTRAFPEPRDVRKFLC